MSPDDWKSKHPGMGSCFHQSLHRWALRRQEGDSWKLAIGVASNETDPTPHLHAWLQQGEVVMAASDGYTWNRLQFYRFVGIDRATVRLVNPRSIMRATKGVIDTATVDLLLNASGIKWRVVDGGVLPG